MGAVADSLQAIKLNPFVYGVNTRSAIIKWHAPWVYVMMLLGILYMLWRNMRRPILSMEDTHSHFFHN